MPFHKSGALSYDYDHRLGFNVLCYFQRLMTMFQRLGETLLRTKRRMLRFERCCSDTNRPDRSSASPRR